MSQNSLRMTLKNEENRSYSKSSKKMRIAIPKETYPLERRVMLNEQVVRHIVNAGHEVFVQSQLLILLRNMVRTY